MPENENTIKPLITPIHENPTEEEQTISPEEEELVTAALQTEEQKPGTAKQILHKLYGFFVEEIPQSHEETDEDGNTITIEDEPKREVNWFKVGACSTSLTLLTIGAIIMLIRKLR